MYAGPWGSFFKKGIAAFRAGQAPARGVVTVAPGAGRGSFARRAVRPVASAAPVGRVSVARPVPTALAKLRIGRLANLGPWSAILPKLRGQFAPGTIAAPMLGDPSAYEGILDDIKGALATAVNVVKQGVIALPGASDAVEYVKAQVGKFFQLPTRITAAQKKAAALQQAAAAKRMTAEAAEALGVSGALASVKGTYLSTESKLTSLLDGLKSAGFGALPVALIAVAVAVAASMAYLFKTVSFNETVLDKIEKKVLTPQEAATLFGSKPLLGISIPWYVWAGIAGVGGYVLYDKFGKRRGGARASA